MKTTCPNCGATVVAPDGPAARVTQCLECGEGVTLAGPEAQVSPKTRPAGRLLAAALVAAIVSVAPIAVVHLSRVKPTAAPPTGPKPSPEDPASGLSRDGSSWETGTASSRRCRSAGEKAGVSWIRSRWMRPAPSPRSSVSRTASSWSAGGVAA